MNHRERFLSENESANEREIAIDPLYFIVAIRVQHHDLPSTSIDVYLQGPDTILESLFRAETDSVDRGRLLQVPTRDTLVQ